MDREQVTALVKAYWPAASRVVAAWIVGKVGLDAVTHGDLVGQIAGAIGMLGLGAVSLWTSVKDDKKKIEKAVAKPEEGPGQ